MPPGPFHFPLIGNFAKVFNFKFNTPNSTVKISQFVNNPKNMEKTPIPDQE